MYFAHPFFIEKQMTTEERLDKLESQTKWLMQLHTSGVVFVLVVIGAYIILKKK